MADSIIHKRIMYHDTDAGGVVYYAKYLEHCEEGRFAYCLDRGVDLGELVKQGILFPVVHLEVEYKSPARYGDVMSVTTRIEKIGTSSVHFYQELKRGDTLLVKAKTVWACVNSEIKSQAVPPTLKQALLS